MRRILLSLSFLLLPLLFAVPALAGNWGEDWGTMIWGAAAAVPSLEVVGVWLLVIAMMAAAGWRLRHRSLQASLMLVLIPLVPLLMAPHYTDWNGFTNGTVAESAVMNENFTTMQGGVNAALTANPVSVPHTFTNGTPANADHVNANFTELETGVTNALNNRATDCAGAGGTWEAGTSTCTPAPAASSYNCFVGGFCAQAAIEFPPGDFNYPNVYEGHTQGTEPALGAGCNDPLAGFYLWGEGSFVLTTAGSSPNFSLTDACGQ